MKIEKVKLEKIFVDPTQPRKTFDSKMIGELASSILKRGLLEPLKVIKVKEGFMLIDGERRFRALSLLSSKGDDESKNVNCIIIDKLREKTLTQLTYDIQKEKIPHLEEAEAYKKLIEDENYSVQDLSMALGKSKSYILSKLKLTAFNGNTRKLISEGKIPVQTLYAIDINKSKRAENRIVERIRKERPSYGEVRRIIFEETKDREKLINLFLKEISKFNIKINRFENKYISLLEKPDKDFYKNQEVGEVIDDIEKNIRCLDKLEKVRNEYKYILKRLKELEYNFGNSKEIDNKALSNSSPPVRTSNSTSLTSDKPKEFNMGLEVSATPTPKSNPMDLTSPNPNIHRNFPFALQSRVQSSHSIKMLPLKEVKGNC